MPADFFIDAERKGVFSKAIERLDVAVALSHMQRLQSHPDFRPEYDQLFDFREVPDLAVTLEELRDLATRAIFSASSRRAFVVQSDLHFGMGRVFGTYRELEGEPSIVVFREIKQALALLSLNGEPDPGRFPDLAAGSEAVGQ